MVVLIRPFAVLAAALCWDIAAAHVSSSAGMSACAAEMDGKLPSFTPADFKFSGNVRRYYVAATEEEWDYVPTGYDNVRGVPLSESDTGKQYLASNTSLGTKYIKGLYRGYTDATFQKRSLQPDWVGLQGPIMRAEVGDMIEILLRNDFPNDYVSMHAMGLFYDKTSEGSDYYNITKSNGKAAISKGDAIPPGECFVFKWLVPQTSSPLASQPSKLWTYHGDINLTQDVDTGLVGPVIVYQSGKMQTTMAGHREFVLFYASTTERKSVFFGKSIQRFLPSLYKPNPGPSVHPKSSANESIWEPIDMDHPNNAIKAAAQAPVHLNGYMFSNLPGLDMCLNDKVIWYIYSLGVFSDGFHVFHSHGNNVQTTSGENVATVQLMPSTMTTVQMTAYNPGIWDVICHNGNHFETGMIAFYRVFMPKDCPKTTMSAA